MSLAIVIGAAKLQVALTTSPLNIFNVDSE